MKTTTETIYTCEKCGATFFFEDACKAHEQECDGTARGKRLADELMNELNRIELDERMKIKTQEGKSILEAVYDTDWKCIVLTHF